MTVRAVAATAVATCFGLDTGRSCCKLLSHHGGGDCHVFVVLNQSGPRSDFRSLDAFWLQASGGENTGFYALASPVKSEPTFRLQRSMENHAPRPPTTHPPPVDAHLFKVNRGEVARLLLVPQEMSRQVEEPLGPLLAACSAALDASRLSTSNAPSSISDPGLTGLSEHEQISCRFVVGVGVRRG